MYMCFPIDNRADRKEQPAEDTSGDEEDSEESEED